MPDAFDRLVADMRRLDGRARVGALDEANAQKLAFSEFGTTTAPPRPTISAAFDRAEATLRRAIDRKIGAVIDGTSEASGRGILSAVGEDFAELTREEIDNNTPPENAPSTLAAKARKGQGDRTLVASGEMRDGIAVESKSDSKPWQDEE
jgi:hypothetical protein